MRTVAWALPFLVCASVMTSSLAARAEQSCAPKTNAAKILRTKNVNDVDPNWAPPAFIGTSWSLIETKHPKLRGRAQEVVDVLQPIRASRDPKDDKFLEVALNGKADLIDVADQRLYDAKRTGRNRCCVEAPSSTGKWNPTASAEVARSICP